MKDETNPPPKIQHYVAMPLAGADTRPEHEKFPYDWTAEDVRNWKEAQARKAGQRIALAILLITLSFGIAIFAPYGFVWSLLVAFFPIQGIALWAIFRK